MSPNSRLATGAGHGGCAIKGLAVAASIARWSPSSSEGSPLRHSDFMSMFRMPTTGRSDSALLLARIGPNGDERRSSRRLAYGVLASILGQAGDTSHSTHQHCPPRQVSIPRDTNIRGPPLAGTGTPRTGIAGQL